MGASAGKPEDGESGRDENGCPAGPEENSLEQAGAVDAIDGESEMIKPQIGRAGAAAEQAPTRRGADVQHRASRRCKSRDFRYQGISDVQIFMTLP